MHAAGYTGSDAIDGIWDGRLITRQDIQAFLRPDGEKDLSDTLSALARSQPHESPLYFIFAHYWMRLMGYSPAAMRGLSVMLGLLAIPGMFWLCLELFKSRTTALLSSTFLIFSPFNILFAQDARPYSLWASITILSSAIFLRATRENKNGTWGLYALSMGIGFYSHQLFVLVAIAHGFYILAVKESRVEGRFFRYIASSILAVLFFSPWLFQILVRWDQVTRGLDWASIQIPRLQYIQRWVLIFSSPFIDLQFGSRNIVPYIMRAPVFLLVGYALFFLVRNTPRRIWVFFVFLIGITTFPFIFSDLLRGGIVSVQGRYFVPANIAVIPVVAYLVNEKVLISKTTFHIKWYLIAALLLAAQVGSAFNILWAKTWWTKNLSSNNPQIVQILNDSGDPLLIVHGMKPTDLGDLLALGLMVDRDVHFRLYPDTADVDLAGDFSDIYWFHQSFTIFMETESGQGYQTAEVVPGRLWRIEKKVE